MKKIINLAFLLFSFTLFSQSIKVNFENEFMYKSVEGIVVWYVSDKYPDIVLVRNISTSLNILHYLGKASYYGLNENNEIEYDKLEFQGTMGIIRKIKKTENTKTINGFKCERFIIKGNTFISEMFITNKFEISNVAYLNRALINYDIDAPILKQGLIVKANDYDFFNEKYVPILELLEIKKSSKSIFIDFEKLNVSYNKLPKHLKIDKSIGVEVIED